MISYHVYATTVRICKRYNDNCFYKLVVLLFFRHWSRFSTFTNCVFFYYFWSVQREECYPGKIVSEIVANQMESIRRSILMYNVYMDIYIY